MRRMSRSADARWITPWTAGSAALLLAFALVAPPAAQAGDGPAWRIDPTHSRVVFDVDHAGFSYSLGTLSNPTGTLRFDPDGWDGAEVQVELPVARLDFGDADWNRAMLGPRWFDADAHPTITFRSTRVEPIDAANARVHGELTVRGVSAPVVLDVRRNGVRRHPLTLRRTAGFSATTELDRRTFGLDDSPSMIGTAVRVRIELEAKRSGRSSAESPSDTPENDDADPQHD
jgi:polyisoprenoid-binding protein YceI